MCPGLAVLPLARSTSHLLGRLHFNATFDLIRRADKFNLAHTDNISFSIPMTVLHGINQPCRVLLQPIFTDNLAILAIHRKVHDMPAASKQ